MREDRLSPELEKDIASEMMHVSRKLLRRSVQAMEALNIGVGQLPILRLLWEEGTLTQRQLAEKIRVTPATICGTVKRMEKSGLICRSASKEDARVSRVSMTEEGRLRYEQAATAMGLPYGEMLAGFTERECRQLQDFIRRMGENLGEGEEKDE